MNRAKWLILIILISCVGAWAQNSSVQVGTVPIGAVFSVDGVQKATKAHFPTSDVFGNVPYPALRLVTCGGPFDPKTGEYLDSIIVYAHLAGLAAK